MISPRIRSPNPSTPDAHSFSSHPPQFAKSKTPKTNPMKPTRILTIAACAAFAFTTLPAFAAEKEHKKSDQAMKVPDTTEGIVAEIHKHHGEVTETIKAKNLKTVHDHAEAITALVNALPAKVAADKKARVEGTAKNIAKVADALHDAADAGDQAKTEAQLKKLDAVLAQLDSQMK